MISFNDIEKLFSSDLQKEFCIEIEFSVKENEKYISCQMGKMPDENDPEKEIYWFGLTEYGSEGYDYENFEDFSSAPVFEGKSMKEIWEQIEIISIDGLDPEKRILVYIG